MDKSIMLSHVDHTLLNPRASWAEIETVCEEAILHKTASVCIPPSYVKRVADKYGDALVVCTVVGFPLGYQTTQTKVDEAAGAVRDGAGEVDMVINLGDVKNRDFHLITAEIAALKKAVGDKVLKVIIETCYLTEEEKIELCKCVTEGGADYIKTSTGFGSAGATLEDVQLFKAHIGPGVKIKAAGGIRTAEDMQAFIELGCERLGTSSAVKILAGQHAAGY
ncbi:MAG: deoxyribose-phosphate aldolase [Oscillospiraceae bacterium]|nr:deoxyribose-phosphate aldolase [Oscillospiraceae bacterium]